MTHYIHGELLAKTYLSEFPCYVVYSGGFSFPLVKWYFSAGVRVQNYVVTMNASSAADILFPFFVDIFSFLNFVAQNIFNASQGVRDLDVYSWTSKAFFPQVS